MEVALVVVLVESWWVLVEVVPGIACGTSGGGLGCGTGGCDIDCNTKILLPTNNMVPFPLMQDVVNRMGIVGVEGMFHQCCRRP